VRIASAITMSPRTSSISTMPGSFPLRKSVFKIHTFLASRLTTRRIIATWMRVSLV
jgi:hypothetical protein